MIPDHGVMAKAQLFSRSLILASVLVGPSSLAGEPDVIRVPGEIPGTSLHAEGAQIYECRADANKQMVWQPREPAAILLDGINSVGRHFAALYLEAVDASTLVWEHKDGSSVKARIVARIAGRAPDDLPWLKLRTVGQAGGGQFHGVTHVQRINTHGGLLHGPCDQAGFYRTVPYSADYVFWRVE